MGLEEIRKIVCSIAPARRFPQHPWIDCSTLYKVKFNAYNVPVKVGSVNQDHYDHASFPESYCKINQLRVRSQLDSRHIAASI